MKNAKKYAIPGNLAMRSIILLHFKNFSPLAKSRVCCNLASGYL